MNVSAKITALCGQGDAISARVTDKILLIFFITGITVLGLLRFSESVYFGGWLTEGLGTFGKLVSKFYPVRWHWNCWAAALNVDIRRIS